MPMKKSRFTEEQIVFSLKQAELGTTVPEPTVRQSQHHAMLAYREHLIDFCSRLEALVLW
jgi:hypothetical protein